ncbi:hypothetical protein O3W47_14920 [Agrobacterium sp. LMR679]|nr:hypothetical protein [Agrobacterium sp. LMR679]
MLTANKNFCTALGYDLTEIVGKHHRIFCDSELAGSRAYQEFWECSRAASSRPRNIAVSARTARLSGSRPLTTRSSVPANPIRS